MSGDEAKLLRSLDRLIEKETKVRDGFTRVKRSAQQAGVTAVDSFGSQLLGKFNALRSSVLSISAAVGVVRNAYSQWRGEMDQLADTHRTTTQTLVKELTETGDLAAAAEVQAGLATTPGATAPQALQLFSGVSAGAPAASLEHRMALTHALGPQAATGVDLGVLGTVSGQLARIAPGLAPDDIADLATSLRAAAGSEINRVGTGSTMRALQMLQNAGLSTEQGLGVTLSAMKTGVEADQLNSLIQLLSKQTEGMPKVFAAAGPLERLVQLQESQQLRDDLNLAPGVQAGLMLLDPQKIAARTQLFVDAQAQNYASTQIEQLRGFGAGSEALTAQQQRLLIHRRTSQLKIEQAQEQRAIDEIQAVLAGHPVAQMRAGLEAKGNRLFRFAMPRDFAPGAADLPGGAGSIIAGAFEQGYLTRQQAAEFEQREAAVSEQINAMQRAAEALERAAGNMEAASAPEPAQPLVPQQRAAAMQSQLVE